MVQRKAPDKPKSSIEHKSFHGGLDRQNRGGADLKKVKSIKVSDFNSFEHSPMDIQFKKTSFSKKITHTPIRNYMKPTSSSDARKEMKKSTNNLQNLNPSSCFSSPKALCGKKNVNRGTCASTLKDSKFPAVLELDHGGNEAEGSSKIRVCPYNYCSLNGHLHEPLPPLKKFISARRNLIKTQRSLKLKRLSSFKSNLLKKEGEMIGDEFGDEIGKNLTDLFVEIYQEEKYHEQCMSQMNESSDVSFEYDYDMDQKSEFSQDEVDDVMMNFLESQIDCEEDGEIKKSEIETMDVNCEEEICFFDDNMEVSESPDNQPSVNKRNSYATSEEPEADLNVIEKENSDISESNSQSINEEVQNLQSEMMNCQSELLDSSNGIDKNIPNVSDVVSNSKWNITKKKTIEEFNQVKEFNPRPPNFLLLEPDPDAEKVDLRHQTMDERRNSEEWMIDRALQQAVTKLGSARKKKVALLVEAFETVVPLPMCEKPLSHGTSAFNHLSFIQACN